MLATWIAACLSTIPATFGSQEPDAGLLEPVEIRAIVLRPSDVDVLRDPASIGVAMQRLAEIGLNAVVPLAWEGGRALHHTPEMSELGFASADAFEGRDVLQEIVFEAHRAGLEVLVGFDGSLRVDPSVKPTRELPHVGAAKDRLDPRDAAVRAAVRGAALELVRAAEVDGIVLFDGLTGFTREEARAPAAHAAVEAARADFAAWRAELRAFEEDLVVGWVANESLFEPPHDSKSLDFVAFSAETKDALGELSGWAAEKPGRAALWSPVRGETTVEAFAKQLAAARAKPWQGELLTSYAALTGRDGLLADALNQGFDAPYYARALLPWRDGESWRPVAELVPLFNDSGTFAKVDADIPFARLESGLPGSASWSLKPVESGPHDLWVYFPPSKESLPALAFTIPTDPRRPQRITLPAGVPNGWTRIGRAQITTTQKQDVLRLEVAASGRPTLEIGALVALPRRRADAH